MWSLPLHFSYSLNRNLKDSPSSREYKRSSYGKICKWLPPFIPSRHVNVLLQSKRGVTGSPNIVCHSIFIKTPWKMHSCQQCSCPRQRVLANCAGLSKSQCETSVTRSAKFDNSCDDDTVFLQTGESITKWVQKAWHRIFTFSLAVTISSLPHCHLLHQNNSSGFSLTSRYFQICTHTEYFTLYVTSYISESQGVKEETEDEIIQVCLCLNNSTYSQSQCIVCCSSLCGLNLQDVMSHRPL